MAPTKNRSTTSRKTRPAWHKPPLDLVERFNAALPVHPEARPRKMFGYPACFVNGHFFVGLHNDDVIVRLPGDLKDRFPELVGAAPFDPMATGKGLKDWWLIPETITVDAQRLTAFFTATFSEIRTLPPKTPKAKAAPKRTRRIP